MVQLNGFLKVADLVCATTSLLLCKAKQQLLLEGSTPTQTDSGMQCGPETNEKGLLELFKIIEQH